MRAPSARYRRSAPAQESVSMRTLIEVPKWPERQGSHSTRRAQTRFIDIAPATRIDIAPQRESSTSRPLAMVG